MILYVFGELGQFLIKALIKCIRFVLYCNLCLFLFSYRFVFRLHCIHRQCVSPHMSKTVHLACWFLPLTFALTLRFPFCPKTWHISADPDILTLYCAHCTIFSGCDGEVHSKTECLTAEKHPSEIFSTHELVFCREHSKLKTAKMRWLVRTFSFNFRISFF